MNSGQPTAGSPEVIRSSSTGRSYFPTGSSARTCKAWQTPIRQVVGGRSAQTGVPFGEVEMVRSFLGIEEPVGRPTIEHPKRPVTGFQCARREVSGARLWGWAESRFESADQFFDRFFIWNDCPLSFMESSGKNRTPDKLPADEREPLYAACDAALRSLVDILQPSMVVGVGAHATKRLSATLAERIEDGLEVGTILHPSPASPAANRGWAEAAERQMTELGLLEGV